MASFCNNLQAKGKTPINPPTSHIIMCFHVCVLQILQKDMYTDYFIVQFGFFVCFVCFVFVLLIIYN